MPWITDPAFIMRQLRTVLLFAAAILMGFAAFVNATVSVPHLHEDLLEINVRPTLLGAVMLGLYFTSFAMAAFACLVFAAAIRSLRSGTISRLPLAIVALTYIGFGILAFASSRSPHSSGYALAGALILAALLTPDSK